jgi:hypothetical protein
VSSFWQIVGKEFNDKCAFLGYYASSSGYFFPTFRDNLSVRNGHYSLRNNTEERSCHICRGGSLNTCKIFYEFPFDSIRDIWLNILLQGL